MRSLDLSGDRNKSFDKVFSYTNNKPSYLKRSSAILLPLAALTLATSFYVSTLLNPIDRIKQFAEQLDKPLETIIMEDSEFGSTISCEEPIIPYIKIKEVDNTIEKSLFTQNGKILDDRTVSWKSDCKDGWCEVKFKVDKPGKSFKKKVVIPGNIEGIKCRVWRPTQGKFVPPVDPSKEDPVPSLENNNKEILEWIDFNTEKDWVYTGAHNSHFKKTRYYYERNQIIINSKIGHYLFGFEFFEKDLVTIINPFFNTTHKKGVSIPTFLLEGISGLTNDYEKVSRDDLVSVSEPAIKDVFFDKEVGEIERINFFRTIPWNNFLMFKGSGIVFDANYLLYETVWSEIYQLMSIKSQNSRIFSRGSNCNEGWFFDSKEISYKKGEIFRTYSEGNHTMKVHIDCGEEKRRIHRW